MRSKCRKFKQKNDIGLIIVDYLQLMTPNRAVESRQQFISDVSRSLKGLARELNVPVIALSQLNRAVDSRTDHRPVLADLRESGAIEQDADVVLLLRRPCRSKTARWHENELLAIVDVAKHRNGETGEVDLNFYKEATRFGDRPQGQRDVAATDAETAEANLATAEEIPDIPEPAFQPDAAVLIQDPLI